MGRPAMERPMTVGEFLSFDDGTSTRYELVDGALIAMNPPSETHARIEANIFRALDRQLRPPCRAYFSGGVWHAETDDTWREPDIFVSCHPGEGFSRAPRLVVEVLSPSTEKEDRTTKLDFYKRFATLRTILLVWQDTHRAEIHERDQDRWIVRDVIGTGAVPLPDIEVELALEEIYA